MNVEDVQIHDVSLALQPVEEMASVKQTAEHRGIRPACVKAARPRRIMLLVYPFIMAAKNEW